MKTQNISKQKGILRSLIVYLGGAWVLIEALNFLIDKYYWNSVVLDVLILVIIFGLPALVIFLLNDGKFTWRAIILHSVNVLLMLSVVIFSIARPGRLDSRQIRLIKFQANQIKMAQNIRALAVLPFSNYTGDLENEAVILGMHDGLINALSRIGGIRVISKTSTLAYANSEKTVREIASDLDVDALIEASVLRVDQGISISVKLVNAIPEQQLWLKTFESPKEDFFSIYNEIVERIANQIQIALISEENSHIENPVQVNPEAYKAYLTGVYHNENPTNKSWFELALENFNRSLALDSMYAPTYAGIAFAWIAALQNRRVTVAEAIPEIYSNNMRALSIDPNYSEAHYINALISAQSEWDWKKSEAAFRKAIESNPNHVLSHAHYGHFLMWHLRFEEAFNELETALDLDPKNPIVLSLYSVARVHHGDLDEALQLQQQLRELQPQRSGLTRIEDAVYYLKGDLKKSMIAIEDNFRTRIRDFERVKYTFETAGYKDAMKELADQLQEKTHVQSLIIAILYNRAGLEDEAIRWLERGYDVHDPGMPYAFLPIQFQNIRSDPRYRALAEKMNLPISELLSN
jgi:TolB-like protein/Tfp pilus assembly protein PilF